MSDLEQEVFDSGASEAPPPDLAPSSPEPSVSPASPDSRAVSDAISALRGPVPQYGTQPTPPPPPPPNPDDEPVKAGVLRDLMNERAYRQQAEAALREYRRKEAEAQAKQQQPKAEDLLFQDPEAYTRSIKDEFQKAIGQERLNFDLQLAAMRHGEKFDFAFNAFRQVCDGGRDPTTYFRVMNAGSPGEELVKWFDEKRLLHQTGGDIDAFRRRVLEEAMQDPEFLARFQNGGMPPPQAQQDMRARGPDGRFVEQQQQPRQEVRLPSSLSKLNGGSRGMPSVDVEDGSEEAIFDAGRTRNR